MDNENSNLRVTQAHLYRESAHYKKKVLFTMFSE